MFLCLERNPFYVKLPSLRGMIDGAIFLDQKETETDLKDYTYVVYKVMASHEIKKGYFQYFLHLDITLSQFVGHEPQPRLIPNKVLYNDIQVQYQL